MGQAKVRTDWVGLLLSLLAPAAVVAGLVWAALQPVSWEDTAGWTWGLIMLVPLEGLRTLVMRVAGGAYQDYRGPWMATISFIGTFAFFVCVVVVMTFLPGHHGAGLSLSDWAAMLSNPWAWQVILAPMAFVVADGALGLLLFRGDARAQGARVGAMAATSEFWFNVALVVPVLFPMPVIAFLLAFGPSWITDLIFEKSRVVALLYAAMYFAGKAVLFAYLYTARFMRTGRCLIIGEKADVIDERRAALTGEDVTLRELIDRRRDASGV